MLEGETTAFKNMGTTLLSLILIYKDSYLALVEEHIESAKHENEKNL